MITKIKTCLKCRNSADFAAGVVIVCRKVHPVTEYYKYSYCNVANAKLLVNSCPDDMVAIMSLLNIKFCLLKALLTLWKKEGFSVLMERQLMSNMK